MLLTEVEPVGGLLAQAASTQDLITWAIIIILVCGGAVFNWIKKQIEESNRRSGKGGGSAGRGPRGGAAGREGGGERGGRPSLDEVTARRREQLRELSRQRERGTGASVGAGGAGGTERAGVGQEEPSNLTMAERIARARAKQQYEQRRGGSGAGGASEGRPEGQRPAARAPQRPEPAADDAASAERDRLLRQADEAREQELAAARARQRVADLERQREAARRRTPQPAQGQRGNASRPRPGAGQPRPTPRPQPQPQRPQPQRPQPPRARSPRPIPTPVADRRVTEPVEPTQAEVGVTEVGLAGAGTVRQRSSGKSLVDFNKLSRSDLRRIIILKEVFDKPIALREQGGQSGPGGKAG